MKLLLKASNISKLIENINTISLRYLINRLKIFSLIKLDKTALFVSMSNNEYFFEIFRAPYFNDDLDQNVQELIQIVEIKFDEASKSNNTTFINKEQFNQLFQQILNQSNIQKQPTLSYINTLIQFTTEQLKGYKWNYNQNQQKQTIYSYILEEQDTVTKEKIIHPSLLLNNESLQFPPAIINQSTFFNVLLQENQLLQQKRLNQYDRLTNLLILYLFEIRDLIQQMIKKELQIQIYPSLFNFNFILKQTQQAYFIDNIHFQTFIIQNSIQLSKKHKKCNYFFDVLAKRMNIQLRIFDFFELESIEKGLILIQNNKYRKENTANFQQYWLNLYREKYQIESELNSIFVKVRQLEYLHSTDCQINSPSDYLVHRIDSKSLICHKCQYQIDDYGTLFYDIQFFKFYQSLKDILLSPYFSDIPGVYICPINLELIQKKQNHQIWAKISGDQELFISIYKQPMNLELQEKYIDNQIDDDDEYYEKLNNQRQTEYEKILNAEFQKAEDNQLQVITQQEI